jgi:hypothetical protein
MVLELLQQLIQEAAAAVQMDILVEQVVQELLLLGIHYND